MIVNKNDMNGITMTDTVHIEQDIHENTFFREATLRICGSLEIEKALWRCLLYIRRFIPADRLSFHIYLRDEGAIETVAYANPGGSVAISIKTPVPAGVIKRLESEEAAPRVRIVDHASREEIAWRIASSLKWPDGPYLEMLLIIEGEILGILALANNTGQPYEPVHARRLSLLNEPFAIALANMLQFRELQSLKDLLADDNRYLLDELRRLSGSEIVGADFGLKEVMKLVRQVAPLPSPVLLLGETGAGKEIMATAIHNLSPRKEKPFIRVNCGAIPETLIDSELFGHEKGAFTGAISEKRGRFERAHTGTIFFDEIGELPQEAQVRMLRVLQNHELERVGGVDPIKVDIRVIAATHRNLEEMVSKGLFREDLYFRLNVFPINIPPLRDRIIDIPALVHFFINKKSKEIGLSRPPKLSSGALDDLKAYSWPGNVRELENAIERALILSQGAPLTFFDLREPADDPRAGRAAMADRDGLNLDQLVSRHIRQVLEATAGRIEGQDGAAELLGLNPGTLRHRMRKLGIPFGRKARPKNG